MWEPGNDGVSEPAFPDLPQTSRLILRLLTIACIVGMHYQSSTVILEELRILGMLENLVYCRLNVVLLQQLSTFLEVFIYGILESLIVVTLAPLQVQRRCETLPPPRMVLKPILGTDRLVFFVREPEWL